MTRFAPRALLTVLTITATTTAQQLATFDPAATPNQEYAAVACGVAPGVSVIDDLISPAAAVP